MSNRGAYCCRVWLHGYGRLETAVVDVVACNAVKVCVCQVVPEEPYRYLYIPFAWLVGAVPVTQAIKDLLAEW